MQIGFLLRDTGKFILNHETNRIISFQKLEIYNKMKIMKKKKIIIVTEQQAQNLVKTLINES